MKSIQIDDDLYHYIASQTQHIGESASDILRRLVLPESMIKQHQLTESQVQTATDYCDTDGNGSDTACDPQIVIKELEAQELSNIPKMVDRWLLALSIIHKHHKAQFAKVLSISGRNRTYFAIDKDTLLETGSSTNPKNVPDSAYWVITNNNTVKKINMLKGVAKIVGFTESDVQQLINVFAPEHMD